MSVVRLKGPLQGTEHGHRHGDGAGALHSPGLAQTSGASLALHSSANLSRIQEGISAVSLLEEIISTKQMRIS